MKLWTFDTEDDSRGNVDLLIFYDGSEYYSFDNRKDAQNFIYNDPLMHNSKIWCCNLEYDITNLFYPYYDKIKIFMVGSRVIKVNSTKASRNKFLFLNTLNHWKISVAKMGEKLGLPKLEYNHEEDPSELEGNELIDYLWERLVYCQRDCEVVYRFVERMESVYEAIQVPLKTTIGASAMASFKQLVSPELPKFPSHELKYMFRGYYGGRNEIFHNAPLTAGKGKSIYYTDINSMYPWALAYNDYPDLTTGRFVKKVNLRNEGICYCEIESNEKYLPYLPHKLDGKKLLFPNGRWTGFYTYFEIRRAIELGINVRRIFSGYEFTRSVKPFYEWVTYYYNKRKVEKDPFMKETYKALLVNLYGKFAERGENMEAIPIENLTPEQNGAISIGNLAFVTRFMGFPKHTNVVWSAYCTAYGRDRLYRFMSRIDEAGGKLLYCDTDSTFYEGSSNIFGDSSELGDMKLEDTYMYAYFKRPKLYHVSNEKGEVYHAKGVHKQCAEEFFLYDRVTMRKPYRIKEAARRANSFTNDNPKQKIVPNYWDSVEKVLQSKYDKREVIKGGRTKPLFIRDYEKKS